MDNNLKEQLKRELMADIYCVNGANVLGHDMYLNSKKYADKLFDDFCNLENKSFGILTERETYILRKRLGLFDYGNKQDFKDIATELSLSSERVRQILSNIPYKLRKSLARDKKNDDIKNYSDKNQISYLLDTKLSSLTDNNIYYTLCRVFTGEPTLRDLVYKSSYDLLDFSKLGNETVRKIKRCLRQYNLSLADDIAIDKKHITKYDVRKSLIYKFEVDEKYYEYINQIVDELYDLKNERILSLSKRETYIIRKIYGILDSGVGPTLTEMSKKLGCSNQLGSEYIKYAFNSLNSCFKKYVYDETIKMSKDEILRMDLKYFNLDEESYINLKHNSIYTLKDLMNYESRKNTSFRYIYYDCDRVQYLMDLVEEKGLTKEEKEEQERKEKERLERIALNEKRKNELLQARSVLLAQKEELAKRMNYYNNELKSIEEKVKKLESK